MDTKPDLNEDRGFTPKPFAVKKVIKNPDGQIQVIYIDARTNKPIANPKGYTVIQSDNTIDNTKVAPQNSVAKVDPAVNTEKSNTDIVLGRGGDDKSAVSQAVKSSNSGYIDKPAIMGFAGLLPGALGLLGMGANLGVNANNQNQISKQREALGFAPQSTLSKVGGHIVDTNGYIGEQKVTRPDGTTSVTPVSFEATDRYNRTTLTPEEARKRDILANAEEATPDERKAAIGEFNERFPEQQSFMSKMIEASKGLFGNMFGGETVAPSGAGTGTGFNTPTGGSGAFGNSFPDKPSPPSNTSTGIDSGRGPQVDTSGYGPGLY